MTTHNVLYSKEQIVEKVKECAIWINSIIDKDPNTVVCPILQSSFLFVCDILPHISKLPELDFCGVSFYDEDGTQDGVFMYKGPNIKLYDNKTVVVVDVICNTGTTMDYTSKLIKQLGAKKVYTASLLYRQFSVYKPDWKGFTISDESVYGYGMDLKTKHRLLQYIAYE